MAAKLILTWNIKPGREQEYFGFMVGEYLPQLNRLGLEMSDAWVTVYGDQPQILVGAVLPSFAEAKTLIESEAWQEINDRLIDFVDDLTIKIVDARGAFQF
jgi:hypothetical protein